jgi:hypothetical protein
MFDKIGTIVDCKISPNEIEIVMKDTLLKQLLMKFEKFQVIKKVASFATQLVFVS